MVLTRSQRRTHQEDPQWAVGAVSGGEDGGDGADEFASVFVTWDEFGSVVVEEEDVRWFVARPPPVQRQKGRVF